MRASKRLPIGSRRIVLLGWLIQLPTLLPLLGRTRSDRAELVERFDGDGEDLALVEIVLHDLGLRDTKDVLIIDAFEPK
jgi:hypothetical protein